MANDCWGPDPRELQGVPTLGGAARQGFDLGPGRVLPLESTTDFSMIISEDWLDVNYGENGHRVPAVTEDARYILRYVLPKLMTQFLEKNKKYAEVENGYNLGSAGIIPDLNRKLGILVARIWNEAPTVGEDTDEVIDDLIGHLLLMRAKRAREVEVRHE